MITKQDLLNWLRKVDKKLKKEMIVIAVGGTAMTLLGLKESTKDVDFCVANKDFMEFRKAAKSDTFIVDIFRDGFIFALQLPEDYEEKATVYKKGFKRLKLKILMLEDIILTKTSRLNTRDIEDIKLLVKTEKINLDILNNRFKQIIETFAGKEEEYRYHFNLVSKMFFSSSK